MNFKSLQVLNSVSAFWQFALFLLVIVWLATKEDGNGSIPNINVDQVIVLLISFTAITASFHTVYASNPEFYKKWITEGGNPLRWIEYSITATIMLLAVAMLSGIDSPDVLILLAASSIGCMTMGYIVERALQRGDKRTAVVATFIGWVLILAAYSAVVYKFYNIIETSGSQPPFFVYAIIWSMAIMFLSFGIIQLTTLAKSKRFYNNSVSLLQNQTLNIKTEAAYAIDSMFSKTLLVGLVFGGVVALG
jgi:hypothetical protein